MIPDLGKYATEVLLAYGISLTLLAVMILVIWRRSRRAKKTLEAVENG
jgi:heme exporter protein D